MRQGAGGALLWVMGRVVRGCVRIKPQVAMGLDNRKCAEYDMGVDNQKAKGGG